MGMLRGGARASLTGGTVNDGAKNGEGGEGATGETAKVLEAFGVATQSEREIIWSGMAQSVTLKQRVALHVESARMRAPQLVAAATGAGIVGSGWCALWWGGHAAQGPMNEKLRLS